MNKFENLNVFRESHKLVLLVYKYSAKFPISEQYGLTSQLRRAAASIVANIIEGNARSHTKEYIQFLNLSTGSLEESKYHLLLAKDLNYLSFTDYNILQEQAEIVGKLLSGLIKYIKSKS